VTGPEHYRQAEELMMRAADRITHTAAEEAEYLIAQAQVHATLAVAAVGGMSAHVPPADQEAWQSAAATVPGAPALQ
jgi:hypothetical protein